ncbi:MAG: SDR family NAD(P)-dependent oxidoreductase [Promethearchaeota archaeon]
MRSDLKMIKEFEGKVAVITGGGSGIGRSMAHTFANRGMKIVIADIDENALNKVTQQLKEMGTAVLSLVVDVSDHKQVAKLADDTYKHFGVCNILCNNAGTVGGEGPAHLLELGDWDWTLGVNLFGVIYGIKFFLKRMLDSKEPCHIVNTASIAGLIAGGGPYTASKFAVVAISEMLALQCFNTNVSVSVLCPGFVSTNIFENTIAQRETRTDVYHLPPAMEDAMKPYIEDTIQVMNSGLSPDLVAEMVIKAIEQDILFIITHPQYMNYVKRRVERINNDSLKLLKEFPPKEREIQIKTYNYDKEHISFSISYPDYLIEINPPLISRKQVFAATDGSFQDLEVHVSRIPKNMRLEDATEGIADILKNFGNNIKIVSNKQIKLKDGTSANEGEIYYKYRGYREITSHHVSTFKENKWIRISIYAGIFENNEDLKKIVHSLEFK